MSIILSFDYRLSNRLDKFDAMVQWIKTLPENQGREILKIYSECYSQVLFKTKKKLPLPIIKLWNGNIELRFEDEQDGENVVIFKRLSPALFWSSAFHDDMPIKNISSLSQLLILTFSKIAEH